MTRRIHKIAWLEPARFPFGWEDQNVYQGILFPRAGPRMAGLLDSLGYDTTVISGDLSPFDLDELTANFDAVCISVISCTTPHGLVLGKQLHDRGLPVVVGGYQFAHQTMSRDSLAPTEEALDFVPYVVRGEGYRTLPELLEAWEGRRPLSSVQGLSYRENGRKCHNPDRPLMSQEEINALPLPRWDKVRHRHAMKIFSVHGLLGCPRRCSWCAVWPRDGRRVRSTDPQGVVDELEMGLRTGHYWHVFMSADNFPILPAWAKAVCEEIIARGIKIPWTCQAEVQAAKRKDLVALMKRAGCVRWCLGLESISDESLRDSEKKQTVAEMEGAIRILHEYDIHIHGMFICGLPHDTPESLRRSVDWAKRMKIETVQFLCLSDLPGSLDYERYRLWERSFRPFTGDYAVLNWLFLNGHYARLSTEYMSLAQVQAASVENTKRFYSLRQALVPTFLPNGDAFRAGLREGRSWWRSLAAAYWHNWLTAGLRWRGFLLIRRWERVPLNRKYCQLLRMSPEQVAEKAEELLQYLPSEWLKVLRQVGREKREREQYQVLTAAS